MVNKNIALHPRANKGYPNPKYVPPASVISSSANKIVNEEENELSTEEFAQRKAEEIYNDIIVSILKRRMVEDLFKAIINTDY